MKFPADASWSMRIKLARTAKGLTQADLAIKIGTSRKHLYRLEHGLVSPNDYTQEKLAQCLNVPKETLFKGVKPC